MIKKGLGKGLGALIPESVSEEIKNAIVELKITEIESNDNQPRKIFKDEALVELAESIKEHGIVQPIVVRKHENSYQIIAGERRWRASRLAGLKTIPVIIKDCTDLEVMELALIENLQREDLNSMEEAHAYKSLVDDFKMTQEDIAKRIGKSRSAVANTIRLVHLPKEIKDLISEGKITAGHARALLTIENIEKQIQAAKKIVEQQMNVRDIEKLAKRDRNRIVKNQKTSNEIEILELEEKLKEIFGTKVKIYNKMGKGKIEIEYYSNEELDRILELMEK